MERYAAAVTPTVATRAALHRGSHLLARVLLRATVEEAEKTYVAEHNPSASAGTDGTSMVSLLLSLSHMHVCDSAPLSNASLPAAAATTCYASE